MVHVTLPGLWPILVVNDPCKNINFRNDIIINIPFTFVLQDKTLVMLSTDHGGYGRGHGRKNDGDLNIPIMLRGPNIKKNNLFKYQVYNKDVVPTALYALGLKPSVYWQGKVMTEAFE